MLAAAETVFTAVGFKVSEQTPEGLSFAPTAQSQNPGSNYRYVKGLNLKVRGDSVDVEALLPDPKAVARRLLMICIVMEMIFLGVFFTMFSGKLFYLVAIASVVSVVPVYFMIPRLLRGLHRALSTAVDLAMMEVERQARPDGAGG